VLATDQATITKIAQAIKAGAIPASMAKAAIIMPGGGEGGGDVPVNVQGRKKTPGPPCCCVQ